MKLARSKVKSGSGRVRGGRFKVYLAGPITGLSYIEATDWRDTAKGLLHPDIDIYSPMRGSRYLEGCESIPASQVQGNQLAMASNRGIYLRDRTDCITSDAILVYYPENSPPSIGTGIEIGWADLLNIPVVAVGPDGNINVEHAMVSEAVLRARDLTEACEIINSILIPD